MLKILPALEGYVLANIATQSIFGTDPLSFVLGDLNADAGADANFIQRAMGPNHSGISLKELLTGEFSQTTSLSNPYTQITTTTVGMSPTSAFTQVSENFTDNLGTLVVSTALSTAGFRVAKKVLRKPINMANRQLKAMGLGATVQF